MDDKYLVEHYNLTLEQLQDWRTVLGPNVIKGYQSIQQRSLELYPNLPPYTLFNLLNRYSDPSFKEWNHNRPKTRKTIVFDLGITQEQIENWRVLLTDSVISGHKSISARSIELFPTKDRAFLHHLLSRYRPDYVTWYKEHNISRRLSILDRLGLQSEQFMDWKSVVGLDVYTSNKSLCNRSKELYPDEPEATLLNILNFVNPPGFQEWFLHDYHYKKSWQSIFEKQLIQDVLPKQGYQVIQYNRLPGQRQIDVFIPSKKFGVELNGYYYHSLHPDSSAKLNINYHRDKTTLALEQGIKLYHFWYEDSDDKNRTDLITSVLFAKLGIFKHKYYARKLCIRDVNFYDACSFYSETHLQGSPNRNNLFKCFGLYDGDTLVSCLSFSYRYNYGLELIRFASLRYSCVVGGFQRLFKCALKNLPNEDIVSYGDRDLIPDPLDSVYARNGFQLVESDVKKLPLQMSYYVPNPVKLDKVYQGLYSRHSFQKKFLQQFTDLQGTEMELAISLGIYPCYNSGTWKYIYHRD